MHLRAFYYGPRSAYPFRSGALHKIDSSEAFGIFLSRIELTLAPTSGLSYTYVDRFTKK